MPTTTSTRARYLSDGRYCKPYVRRLIGTVSVTSGTVTTYAPFETMPYAVCRACFHVTALAANTTMSISLVTGPTSNSSEIDQLVRSSSGASAAGFATTGLTNLSFPGLDRWSKFRADTGGAGGGGCTGLSVDVELI